MTNDELINPKAVIPSEVAESRGETLRAIDRILRLRFGSLRMTVSSSFGPRHSFVIRHWSLSLCLTCRSIRRPLSIPETNRRGPRPCYRSDVVMVQIVGCNITSHCADR